MGNSLDDGSADFLTDFDRDEAIIADYEKAKQLYIRTLTEESEIKLRYGVAQQREAINIEIATLRNRAKEKLHEASAATAAYAVRLPHRVAKTGVTPPSLWERLVTMNQIDRFYRAAADAARDLEALNAAMRTDRERLDAMEREVRRSIYLREEAARKHLETPEGVAAFHAHAMNQRAFDDMQRVLRDRAAYDERVARGEVPPAEARDREMSQRRQRFARVPMLGVMIVRIVRYADLEYYVLRDLEQYEYLIACSPALEPLRDLVFDVTETPGGIEAALRYTTAEVPMRALDHLRATLSAADAAEAYARHRTALRTDRPLALTSPSDPGEIAVSISLTMLANAVAEHGVALTAEGAGAA